MLSLAYRIATMPPIHRLTGDKRINQEALAGKVVCERAMIGKAKKIRLDNVASFYASHPRERWTIEDDIPNFAPPFGVFWSEWVEPTNWVGLDDKMAARASSTVGQFGYLCMAMKIVDEFRNQPNYYAQLIAGAVGGTPDFEPQMPVLASAIARCEWMLILSSWAASTDSGLRPVCLGLPVFVFLEKTGRCFKRFCVPLYADNIDSDGNYILGSPTARVSKGDAGL